MLVTGGPNPENHVDGGADTAGAAAGAFTARGAPEMCFISGKIGTEVGAARLARAVAAARLVTEVDAVGAAGAVERGLAAEVRAVDAVGAGGLATAVGCADGDAGSEAVLSTNG